METRLRIMSSDLQIGMCVVDLDRPWLETPFLFQGFTISSPADIQVVQQYCHHVYIDPSRGTSPQARGRAKAKDDHHGMFGMFTRHEAPAPSQPVERELSRAREIHNKTSTLVRGFMDDIRLGRAFNVQAVEDTVTDIVDSLLRQPDAMTWMAQLRSKHASEEQHCINVCIMAVAFGRHLGLPKSELQKVGICALLHDVGKLQIADTLLKSDKPLSEGDLKILRKHPEFGRVILLSARGLYPGAIDVAHTHHEHVNGEGYPRGLSGTQIAPFAKIVAIVDAYDQLTTAHPWRSDSTSFEAMKTINAAKGKQFDESLVKHFIDMIGVFPIGSLVELNSGEIAVVVGSTPQQPTKPRVMLMLDHEHKPRKEQMVNLASISAVFNGEPLKVVRVLRRGDYNLDPQKLHERAMAAMPKI